MRRLATYLAMTLLLAGCAADRPAPVTDFSIHPAKREPQEPPTSYTVDRGDTLYSIAFRYGLDHRELARWNGIGEPYTIYPGQELRFSPGPGRASASGTSEGGGRVVVEPLPQPTPPAGEPAPDSGEGSGSGAGGTDEPEPAASRAREPQPRPAPAPPAETVATPSSGDWRWPADGRLLSRFVAGDSARNGVDIAGEPGDAVMAAAPGVVVYSGSGLIGYGELIIVKHGATYLSAYGHNRKRLVDEGDSVEAGQRIAEMGSTGARRSMLHFEIRKDGKPVDPLKYLPAR